MDDVVRLSESGSIGSSEKRSSRRPESVAFTADRIRKFQCSKGKSASFEYDGGARGVRGLGVKCTARNQRHPNGTKTYFVEGRLDGATVRIKLGDVQQWTLERARRRAARLRLLLDESVDPRVKRRSRTEKRKADAAAQIAKAEAGLQATVAAQQAAEEAGRYSLKALCERYIDHLKAAGKPSWRDAASLFRVHVYPSRFADKPAREITARDVTELLRTIIEGGHGRTSAKTRSFLRAAFQIALSAELDATVPAALMAFDITANPAASTNALARFNATRDRVLSVDELRSYLVRLRASADTITKIPLLVGLLLGGQRPMQLLRVRLADVDLSGATITLRDGKGKRQRPRVHVLPLVGEAHTLLADLYERRWRQTEQARKADPEGPAARGDVPLFAVGQTTLSAAVRDIRRAMLAADEARSPFELRDLRRTSETLMAAMGIGKEIRAQLQSHDLGGVMARHYTRHDFASEKCNALTAWAKRLTEIETATPKASNVVDFPSQQVAA